MSQIKWNEDYSVNINLFDDQHKQLIEIYNELEKALKLENNSELVAKHLNDLVLKTIYHFAVEEKVMKEQHYEGYSRHKQSHEYLTLQLIESLEYFNKKKILKPEFLLFVKTWLINHITEADKKYSPFLDEKKFN